ncbi:vacuolar h+-atpase assembly protein [Diplodia corticola]|uniref:Vacuolar h+-atpase assembly protein n=1 Tax=Diplodia corticola TaxID=236234 RepID=A0A1J9QQ39_9PEZI|nr:vacuolar h+-atpase assembly protein [Diplodia corticola]OJD30569.1 vacuolar h+-atpase assembly protein [Diplodia corticola]
MVLLTMTPSIVAAVKRYEALAGPEQTQTLQLDGEPQLSDPASGNPISHAQLIAISDALNDGDSERPATAPSGLNHLLRGSRIYVPPPPPRPEPSNEYKQLMARLRKEEEARAYERMLNPPQPTETFGQRFPASNAAHLFAVPPTDGFASNDEDDEVTYADINRQLALIINVLVSIIACSCALWMVARYWSTPARLALSMTGSTVVAVAEVAVYMGYLRKIKEAKIEEKKKPEIKEVAETWVIEGGGEKKSVAIQKTAVASDEADTVRRRKGNQK